MLQDAEETENAALRGEKGFSYNRYYYQGYRKNHKKLWPNLNSFGFFFEKP